MTFEETVADEHTVAVPLTSSLSWNVKVSEIQGSEQIRSEQLGSCRTPKMCAIRHPLRASESRSFPPSFAQLLKAQT